MNKFRLNNKIHNHISFIPVAGAYVPEFKDIIEEQAWAEDKWNYLLEADLKRHSCHVLNKPDLNKHMITVWTDNQYVYLITAIRSFYNTTKTTVYFQPFTEDNLSDFKAIAKFTHKNIGTLKEDYKNLVIDARNYILQNNIHISEENDEREEHTELN